VINDNIFNQSINISNCIFEEEISIDRTEFEHVSLIKTSITGVVDSFFSKFSKGFFALNSNFSSFLIAGATFKESFMCSSVRFDNTFKMRGT